MKTIFYDDRIGLDGGLARVLQLESFEGKTGLAARDTFGVAKPRRLQRPDVARQREQKESRQQ